MKTEKGITRPAAGALKSGAALLMLALLAACGKEEQAASGQALASVDGKEITIHQLNAELGKGGAREANKQLLDGLVARQVLVNAARKEKLDADPAVLADMERARDLVLAQSYVQRKLAKPTRPSQQEVSTFYDQHPDWFAQRQQYEFAELVIDRASVNEELTKMMVGVRPLEEVAAWLQKQHIPFTRLQVTKTSMDLPPPMLAGVKKMEKGQLFIVNEGDAAILAALADVRNVPLSRAAATQQIEQYLANQRQGEITEQAVARLKADAKIVYFDSAKTLKDNSVAPVADATSPGKDAAAGAAIR
ncbi:EpsD family peptidyl-prolyl cis-trans isomerase [Herbaspirillum seropedicae]|uniref:EpsD family peptidyl-prolyl cis-trans isomerase n=1 Tax=Herbaspirillum seropedicae TaxID=964 RepID=UPI003D984916